MPTDFARFYRGISCFLALAQPHNDKEGSETGEGSLHLMKSFVLTDPTIKGVSNFVRPEKRAKKETAKQGSLFYRRSFFN